MKVLLVNGSTHPQGGTWQDLSVVEEVLDWQQISMRLY